MTDELAHAAALQRHGAAADLARAVGFMRAFARRRAPRKIPVPGGFAVLDDRYPGSYDDNKLIVGAGDGPAPAPDAVLQAADETLADRAHRLVTVDDDRLGRAFADAFAAAGYHHETSVVMAFRGEIPADPPAAEQLGLEDLLPVLRRDWRRSLPQASEQVIDQLARRVETRLRGADVVAFRGVRAPGGEIAARADLYVHGAVAQIEDVFTGEEHRGRGYARTLMNALLAEAAGAELIFLVADDFSWPKDFYARLGFEELGRVHAYLRT